MSDSKATAMRRIDFLIAEAKAWTPASTRDLAITFALRSVSNYATIGRDGQSFDVKLNNPRVSAEAKLCLERIAKDDGNIKDWHIKTRNEHERPIDCIWQYLVRNPDVEPDAIWSMVRAHPMVTVTQEEDKRLGQSRCKCTNAFDCADARYDKVEPKIVVVQLGMRAADYFEKVQQQRQS